MERTIETNVTQAHELPDPPRRRFTLGDIMGLVMATAFTLVLLRTAFGLNLFAIQPNSPLGGQLVGHLPVAFGCILIPLTFTLLILSVCDDRTPRRDIIQGTGFVTCVVVALSALWPVLYFVVRATKAAYFSVNMAMDAMFYNMFVELRHEAGPMTLGAWIALTLMGRWRVGPSWIDRAGCFVGISYILLFVHARLYFVLSPFLLD